MLRLKRLLPCLLFIFYVQSSYCYAQAEEGEEEQPVEKVERYSVECAARDEILPCKCYQHGTKEIWIQVICQKMDSYDQIIKTLRKKIADPYEIQLVMEYSNLDDLAERRIGEVSAQVIHIWLTENKIRSLSKKTFVGGSTITTFVIVESKLTEFPGEIFEEMPKVEVLSVERSPIGRLTPADFVHLKKLKTLVVRKCSLTELHGGSTIFPESLIHIDLVSNNLTTLNHTLRNGSAIEWIFLANNKINSLEGQLPDYYPNYKLAFLDVSFNELTSLPQSFVHLHQINSLTVNGNKIRNIDGLLRNKKKLVTAEFSINQIEWLASDEFENCEHLADVHLAYNAISSLNNSLLHLKSLQTLNLTHNNLTEFSLSEVPVGMQGFTIDLSHNQLRTFNAFTDVSGNNTHISLIQLNLQFNELEMLNGYMADVKDLVFFNISHNKLTNIRTEFLAGLSSLRRLDLSFNRLITLQNIWKANLVALHKFYANNNQITELTQLSDKPSKLCFLYLRNNKIEKVNTNFSDLNQCFSDYGFKYTLYVYMNGNPVLCRDDITNTSVLVNEKNNYTRIVGCCSSKRICTIAVTNSTVRPQNEVTNNSVSIQMEVTNNTGRPHNKETNNSIISIRNEPTNGTVEQNNSISILFDIIDSTLRPKNEETNNSVSSRLEVITSTVKPQNEAETNNSISTLIDLVAGKVKPETNNSVSTLIEVAVSTVKPQNEETNNSVSTLIKGTNSTFRPNEVTNNSVSPLIEVVKNTMGTQVVINKNTVVPTAVVNSTTGTDSPVVNGTTATDSPRTITVVTLEQ